MKKAVRSLARRSALNSGNNFSSGPRLLSAEPRLSRRVTSGPETVGEMGGNEGEEKERETEMAGFSSRERSFHGSPMSLHVPAAEPVTSFNEC